MRGQGRRLMIWGEWFGGYIEVLTRQTNAPTDEWICSFVRDQQAWFGTSRPLDGGTTKSTNGQQRTAGEEACLLANVCGEKFK